MRPGLQPQIPIDNIHSGYREAARVEISTNNYTGEIRRDLGTARHLGDVRNVEEDTKFSEIFQRCAQLGYPIPIALSAALIVINSYNPATAQEVNSGGMLAPTAPTNPTPVTPAATYSWEITEALLQERYAAALRSFEAERSLDVMGSTMPLVQDEVAIPIEDIITAEEYTVSSEVKPVFYFNNQSIILSPEHPVYGSEYGSYVQALKRIQGRSVGLMELLEDVAKYTHVTFPHNLGADSREIYTGRKEELMARFHTPEVPACGDMAFLTQFGLHSLGVHSTIRTYDLVATRSPDGGDLQPFILSHANLVVRLGVGSESDFVLEMTEGFIMSLSDFREYLMGLFAPVEGVINERVVLTGLE